MPYAHELAIRIGFVLIPDFHMMALIGAIEPLRVSNHISGQPLCDWLLYSTDGNPVTASNRLRIDVDGPIEDCGQFDLTLICASMHADQYASAKILSNLRRWNSEGRVIGAMDSGTMILARAGLLDGFRATANYNELEGLREQYPNVEFTDHLFEIDRNKVTCAAGTAPVDLMLNVVKKRLGNEFATRVSSHMFHERIRESSESQHYIVRHHGYNVAPKIRKAINVMEAHVDSHLSIESIAKKTGTTIRELQRSFRRHFKQSPTEFYMRLRMERARQFLNQTEMSVLSIALACGFESQEHFARRFKQSYGHTPREERARGRYYLCGDMQPQSPSRPDQE